MSRRSIAGRYATRVAVLLALAMLASGGLETWASHRDRLDALEALHREQAQAAAAAVSRFIDDVLRNLEWVTLTVPQAGDGDLEPRRLDLLKLLRLEAAITTVTLVDPAGRERLRVSRILTNRVASGADLSGTPGLAAARAGHTHFGGVHFIAQTEPTMTIAAPSALRDGSVVLVDLNLKLVQSVVSRIEVGRTGYAYVVDSRGQLVSHRDLALVLQMNDLSRLPQVIASRDPGAGSSGFVDDGSDLRGAPVLSSYARIAAPGWTVFVDQPRSEALAPLFDSVARSAIVFLLALTLAIAAGAIAARRMVAPIGALRRGAQRFAAGDLTHRIEVVSGDELEELAAQFNAMAAQLLASYVDLERRVAERTRDLDLANESKSRFLAAASHDLRQPMHALGLFVGQLRTSPTPGERATLLGRIEQAVSSLAVLLDQLLDLSKLEAGAVQAVARDFALRDLLASIHAQLAPLAQAKSIELRVRAADRWLLADPVLVQRILLNLVVNAIRYTDRGAVLVGCRPRAGRWRIEVWDSGRGIPADRQQDVFREFVRLEDSTDPGAGGLGLGLAIIARLADLLGTRVELRSRVGRGSVFAFELPRGTPCAAPASRATELSHGRDLRGLFVVVVDDDEPARIALCGLLERWGCLSLAAADAADALGQLASHDRPPELIISDYRLAAGEDGLAAIARIREAAQAHVPAILVTAETGSDLASAALASRTPLLHKPVSPVKLRALLASLLAPGEAQLRA